MRLSLGLALLLALVSSSCTRAATQLTVEVDSDLPASRLACVHVEVAPIDDPSDTTGHTFHVALTDRTPLVALPFSFGVTPPSGDTTRRVELSASAYPRDACTTEDFASSVPFVTRRVRTGFLSQRAVPVSVFLSADCVGITCTPEETCDLGRCVPIPEIDPSATDAGVPSTGPTFYGERPAPVSEVTQGPLPGLHDVIYPVGVSGGRHVLLAGAITSDVTFGTRTIAAGDGTVFLAKITTDAGATPDWVVTLTPAVGSFPVIRRMLPLADGGYVFCGTSNAPFDVPGDTIAGSAADFAFVGRVDATGELVTEAFHTLDATTAITMGTPSPHARCTDLAVKDDEVLASVRVWNAGGPWVDSTARTPRGMFLDAAQNLLVYPIALGPRGLTVADPIVMGHALTTASMDAGFEGTPFFVRSAADASSDVIFAAIADDLEHGGSSVTDPSITALRVRRVGPVAAWEQAGPVVTSPDIEVQLEALETSPSFVWLAITMRLSGEASADVTVGRLAPFTITRDATYLVRLDTLTGTALGVTALPPNVDFLVPEDEVRMGERVAGEPDQLYGGWLATTGRDEALYATATLNDQRFADTPTAVMANELPQADPFLAIVDASGAPIAGWQWAHAAEHSDWRLTHVAYLPTGFVAVSGYVESTGTTSAPDRAWHRDRSFFEILRTR